MSEQSVEIVRGIYDAIAARDGTTPFEFYAHDVVWDMSRARTAFLYSQPVYVGHEGVREVWREGLAAFGDIDMKAEELVAAGDRVLAVVREREVGRASGAPVATHFAVWTVAEGKVTRMQMFDDRQEAVAAAGLPSQ